MTTELTLGGIYILDPAPGYSSVITVRLVKIEKNTVVYEFLDASFKHKMSRAAFVACFKVDEYAKVEADMNKWVKE